MKVRKSFLFVFALFALAGCCFARTVEATSLPEPLHVEHVQSVPEVKYSWGMLRWLMNGKIDRGAEQTFGAVDMAPGLRSALHSRRNSEDILYVLSGPCEHILGEQKVVVRAGDLVRIPRHTNHQATVLGNEPLRAVISYSTHHRQVAIFGDSKK